MTGKLAISRAGHDAGKYYVVVREEEDCVFLADGVIRTVARPKKKNRRHIQIIKNLPPETLRLIGGAAPAGDLEIKRAIKLYVKQEENECQKQM